MAGYPGTIAATWQRAGRAGRRTTRSAAVLVASSAPIDQFIVRNPSYFFDGVARARADQPRQPAHPARSREVRGVRAAVHERRALRRGGRAGEVDLQAILSVLSEEGFVHHADGQWNWTNESYPADAVSLRSVSSDNFVVVDCTSGERVIGETDFTSGPRDAPREGDLHRSKDSCSRWSGSISTDARRICARWTATTTPTRSPTRRSRSSIRSRRDPRAVSRARRASELVQQRSRIPAASGPTARSTSCRVSWGSRRSSSTRTRTSVRASSICPSSRCTRRRTG